jgi:hypothetical protein
MVGQRKSRSMLNPQVGVSERVGGTKRDADGYRVWDHRGPREGPESKQA